MSVKEKKDKEVREFLRVEQPEVRYTLIIDKKHIDGEVENISIGGVLLSFHDQSMAHQYLGRDADIVLYVNSASHLSVSCKIIHVSEIGVGVKFTSIDPDAKKIINDLIDVYIDALSTSFN